jgi:hypothetical protein
MNWTEPKSNFEWFQRLISVRALMMSMFFLVLFVSELRFDWIELTIGSYLVSTNGARPESGAIWEVGKQTRSAQQAIDKIVSDRQSSYREAGTATSFKQIAATIQLEEWLLVPPDLFRKLYLQLPPELAREIVPPFELLELANNQDWDRTYFEKDGGGLNIYLLNRDNRVLRKLHISTDLLYLMAHNEIQVGQNLDELAEFSSRIYDSDYFFKVLRTLSPEVRQGIIRRPEQILNIPGRIVRVGISDEAISGFIQIGFEIETGTQDLLLLIQGHEWAVWRLHSALEADERG